MSTSHLIHLGHILHYITLTFYYIVKDTFRWQVITVIADVEKENNGVKMLMSHLINTLRIYTTLYHTYPLLYCKGHIHTKSNYSIIEVEK